jgi:hypothetical protein
MYMWAFQVLSARFQGGCVTHTSIVERKEEQTNKGETFDESWIWTSSCKISIFGKIFPYLVN